MKSFNGWMTPHLSLTSPSIKPFPDKVRGITMETAYKEHRLHLFGSHYTLWEPNQNLKCEKCLIFIMVCLEENIPKLIMSKTA